MPYPHDAIIRAWLDGRTVQYYDEAEKLWVDIEPVSTAAKLPHCYRNDQYRIKPVTLRYRVALMRSVTPPSFEYPHLMDSLQGERTTVALPQFVRFLTDWTEVVV